MSVACRHVKFSVPLVEQAVDIARGLFEDLVEDGIDEVRRRVGNMQTVGRQPWNLHTIPKTIYKLWLKCGDVHTH